MQINFFIGISGNLPRADKSAVIRFNLSHEERQKAGRSVGVTLMVTRRGWECGPVPCCERNERAARPSHGRPSRSPLRMVRLMHIRADKSAVCTINRHLHCHPEPFAAAQGKLSEGCVALGSELLRGVYPERSE